ncbi:response regulator [Stenotrophomonas rhizophila]|uniref:response regulator n=1 Tax=Stenotrophomonas rhizophila TaxID=216778 RepID=UPI001E4ABF76|nr:response regulator [Stenotrophomonas rhizophila]MCC7634826.1 response regulator transcription factor [Stenotrophomonas rhizophila]MCC7664501.1 response regulator transcription factor [Stenotrophomonas rhizophila]
MTDSLENLRRPLRVMLLDDHPLVRFGLEGLLNDDPATCVVGSFGTSQELLDALAGNPTAADVVLADYVLAAHDRSCRQLLGELGRAYPALPVVVFSSRCNDATVAEARQAGARGYLFKGERMAAMVQTLVQLCGTAVDASAAAAVAGAAPAP